MIERDLGDMQLALKYINEAIAHRESMNKVDQLQAWNIIYKGLIYRDMGDYASANLWTDKGDVLYSQFDMTTKMYACVKFYKSGIYRFLGNYAEAEKWLQFGLNICEREAAESPIEIGFGKTLLAKVYRNTGHLDKAFTEAQAAEKLYVDLFGEKNLRTSWIRMTIGQIYKDQGKYSEAKDIFQKCLDVHRTMLKDTHPKIGKILSELGYAQVKLGDIKQGHANLEKGLKNYENHYGKDHLRTAYVLRLISESLQIQGDMKGAEAAAVRAHTICKKANHPDQIVSLERLGDVRIKAGNAQGNGDLKKALEMAKTTFGGDSPHVARIKAKV